MKLTQLLDKNHEYAFFHPTEMQTTDNFPLVWVLKRVHMLDQCLYPFTRGFCTAMNIFTSNCKIGTMCVWVSMGGGE
jgi:hypothetical protein